MIKKNFKVNIPTLFGTLLQCRKAVSNKKAYAFLTHYCCMEIGQGVSVSCAHHAQRKTSKSLLGKESSSAAIQICTEIRICLPISSLSKHLIPRLHHSKQETVQMKFLLLDRRPLRTKMHYLSSRVVPNSRSHQHKSFHFVLTACQQRYCDVKFHSHQLETKKKKKR